MTFSDGIPVDSSKTGITFENALGRQRADGPSLAIFLSLGAVSPSLTKKTTLGSRFQDLGLCYSLAVVQAQKAHKK